MVVLRARAIRKRVGIPHERALELLRDINLDVSPGEVVAIMGPSGCGKSTLLAIIGMLSRPNSGSLEIHGTDVLALSDRRASGFRNRELGFVFQNYSLLPFLTVAENVAVPLRLSSEITNRQISTRVSDSLERISLGGREHSAIRELSGGEQQRVAIARALVTRPSIVLADEPTGSLDVRTGKLVLDCLFALCASETTTMLLVTHDASIAARATRAFALDDGVLRTLCA